MSVLTSSISAAKSSGRSSLVAAASAGTTCQASQIGSNSASHRALHFRPLHGQQRLDLIGKPNNRFRAWFHRPMRAARTARSTSVKSQAGHTTQRSASPMRRNSIGSTRGRPPPDRFPQDAIIFEPALAANINRDDRRNRLGARPIGPLAPRRREASLGKIDILAVLTVAHPGVCCHADGTARLVAEIALLGRGVSNCQLGIAVLADAGRSFWVEAYGGRPYRVERQRHEPIEILRLTVAVVGSTQPDKIAELVQQSDDGLLSRFLWVWPDPVPFRLGRITPDIGWAITALDRLRELQLQIGDPPQPIYGPLDRRGQELLEAFGRDMQERRGESGGLQPQRLRQGARLGATAFAGARISLVVRNGRVLGTAECDQPGGDGGRGSAGR